MRKDFVLPWSHPVNTSLLCRCWRMELSRREEFKLSFAIFVDAGRSSTTQTSCACLCHSGCAGFMGCGSFLHFHARGENPEEECQHYPAVPQMVPVQTISFLLSEPCREYNIQPPDLRTQLKNQTKGCCPLLLKKELTVPHAALSNKNAQCL